MMMGKLRPILGKRRFFILPAKTSLAAAYNKYG